MSSVRYIVDPFDENDEIMEFPSRCIGMRKMSQLEKEKFPNIVADSIRCQLYYICRSERCNGCNLAVDGCEKVFMSAG